MTNPPLSKPVLLLLLTALLTSACSTGNGTKTGDKATQLAADKRIAIIRADANTTYESLAAEYLGQAAMASVIQRYNPGLDISPGSYVLVPLENLNPSAVYSDGYQQVPVLCYHQFTDEPANPNRMVVAAGDFAEQMAHLKHNGYQVVPLSAVSSFLKGDAPLPDKSVVLTVDDGYASFLTVAYPILRRYNFPITLFVYPEFIGGGLGLSWEQLKMLEQDPLVDIQSHSRTHASLSPDPEGENPQAYRARIREEVVSTDAILQRKLGRKARHFAYPYGDSSSQAIAVLQENQYDLALTVNSGGNATFAFPYLLRRTMVYGDIGMDLFQRHLEVFYEIGDGD